MIVITRIVRNDKNEIAFVSPHCIFDVENEVNDEFNRVRSFDRDYWQARQNRKAEIGVGGYCD